MREIDLIPREHVEQRRLRRIVLRTAITLGAVLVATAAGRIAIGVAIARERPVADRLRLGAQSAGAERAQLAQLSARKADLDARLAAWRRLQEPAPWRPALSRIDTAFSRGLWFDQLALQRVAAPAAPSAAASAGVLTTAAPRQQGIEIKGHALDHAALMSFTRALGEQPGLRGVRLLDTSLRRYSMAEVVDFTVSARLEAPAGGPP